MDVLGFALLSVWGQRVFKVHTVVRLSDLKQETHTDQNIITFNPHPQSVCTSCTSLWLEEQDEWFWHQLMIIVLAFFLYFTNQARN